MFTGIIEEKGYLVKKIEEGTNVDFHIRSAISKETYIDQSIAHNGVCLTVISNYDDIHVVTAIQETLIKSNLGKLAVGDEINLERAMLPNKRMDGHIVQGHVDGIARCCKSSYLDGSWMFEFEVDEELMNLIVDKGSVTINGVSLTVCNPENNSFQVNIIPYTFEHTNFGSLKEGSEVNIEFDIIGKYVVGYLSKLPSLK